METRTRTLFLFAILSCVIAMAFTGDGDENKTGKDKLSKFKEKMKKCHNDTINTEEALKGFEECKKGEERRRRRSPGGWGGGKGGKMGENYMCAGVCMLTKQGVFDDSGKFNEAGCKKQVDKVYPEKYRDAMQEIMKKCSEDHSSKFSMNNKCKGYKDFMKCAKKGHKEACGMKWKGKGKGKGMPKVSDDDEGNDD